MVMRTTTTLLGLLALALLLSLATPVASLAHADAVLPPIRLAPTSRFEHAFSEDGRVVLVGQGFKESRERIYIVLKNLAGPFAGRVRELVLYDGAAYLRIGDDPQWQPLDPARVEALIPSPDLLLLFDGPLSELGPVAIGSTPTTHYQIWGDHQMIDPSRPGFVKVDFFVGTADQYLYQLQLTATTVGAAGSRHELGTTIRFFDQNDPTLKVIPPIQP